MAEKQGMGVSQKHPRDGEGDSILVQIVEGPKFLAPKLSIGVTQKVPIGAQWTQSDSPPRWSTGVTLNSPTVITSCTKEADPQGMGVSLKVPTVAIT